MPLTSTSASSSAADPPPDEPSQDIEAADSKGKAPGTETYGLAATRSSDVAKVRSHGVATVVPVGAGGYDDMFISEPQRHLMKQELSILSLVGFGMEVMNGWVAIGLTLVVGLSQGGISVVIYGTLLLFAISCVFGASLAESASSMPSAGGQYVWSYVLAPPRWRREISFVCGIFSICAWAITAASIITSVAQFCLAIAMSFHPDYIPATWHLFLIYLCLMSLGVAYNVLLVSRTPWLGSAFIYLPLGSFLVTVITCVARAETYQDSRFVWATYSNEIGCTSPFVVVLSGLINPAFVFLGIDSAVHLADESRRPERDIPRAMLVSICAGLFTAFPFAIVLGYCVQDIAAASESLVPLFAIMEQATRSRAAAVVFLVAIAGGVAIGIQACILATSRLIERHRVPHYAILATVGPVVLLGILLLAAQTAYNAIVSTALIFSYLSMAIPVSCLLVRRRRFHESRWLKLGWVGWVVNVVAVGQAFLLSIMWLFPLQPDTDAGNMNWGCVVIGVVFVLMALDWFLYARTRFAPPVEQEWIRTLST